MPKNAFGFDTGPSGTFTSIMKYDARAGRFFRVDRVQDNTGNFVTEDVDITHSLKAIVDFANLMVGWMYFATGTAPDFKLVPYGNEIPDRPSDKHKNGVRIMMKLSKDCGGDKPIRELAGTSKALISGLEALFVQYLAEKDGYPGKLPVVVLEKTTLVKSGSSDKASTNYQPVFKIIAWAERGDLGSVAPPLNLDSNPPAAGSTLAEAPVAAEMVDADDF
jgi:hypothetical protein